MNLNRHWGVGPWPGVPIAGLALTVLERFLVKDPEEHSQLADQLEGSIRRQGQVKFKHLSSCSLLP